MRKTYLSRALTRAFSSEMPIGDPFGGPAYGEYREPVTAAFAAVAASGFAAGAAAVLTVVSTVATVVGVVTGSKTLMGIGALTGLGAGIAGATGATGLAGEAAAGAATDAAAGSAAAAADASGFGASFGTAGQTAAPVAAEFGTAGLQSLPQSVNAAPLAGEGGGLIADEVAKAASGAGQAGGVAQAQGVAGMDIGSAGAIDTAPMNIKDLTGDLSIGMPKGPMSMPNATAAIRESSTSFWGDMLKDKDLLKLGGNALSGMFQGYTEDQKLGQRKAEFDYLKSQNALQQANANAVPQIGNFTRFNPAGVNAPPQVQPNALGLINQARRV